VVEPDRSRAERVLTTRELNRAVLARQLLLERARLSIPRAVERVAGLQTQYAPTAYIGLWSRVAGFERDALTRALERRAVVQGTLMRSTIHVVSRADYAPLADAVRAARRAWWFRATKLTGEAAAIEARDRRVRELLREGPLKRAEIVERLGLQDAVWSGVGLYVDLVRVPPSGTWAQRRADRYAVAEDWIGPWERDPDRGLEILLRRYLGGFGPASAKDVVSFTGLPATVVSTTLGRLSLRRFRDEAGTQLWDLPRAPLPEPETPAPVRFLGTWEAVLLVHARRTQVLPEAFRPRVFATRTPHSSPTFLVDGQVAGTWRHERNRIVLDAFRRLSRDERRAVDDEAERLLAFLE
jgi:Winged helix DNA-binding domain